MCFPLKFTAISLQKTVLTYYHKHVPPSGINISLEATTINTRSFPYAWTLTLSLPCILSVSVCIVQLLCRDKIYLKPPSVINVIKNVTKKYS